MSESSEAKDKTAKTKCFAGLYNGHKVRFNISCLFRTQRDIEKIHLRVTKTSIREESDTKIKLVNLPKLTYSLKYRSVLIGNSRNAKLVVPILSGLNTNKIH